MKTLSTSAIALVAALGLGTGAALAEGDSGASGDAAANTESSANMESIAAAEASTLKGKTVKNHSGEDIGDVSDIVTNMSGQQRYAVVSVGDFLGIGGKEVAVPFSELSLEGDNLILMSQNAMETLEERPEYNEEKFRPLQAESSDSETPSAE